MPSPELWVAVVAALRRYGVPSAVLPTGVEIRLTMGGTVNLPLFPPDLEAQIEETAKDLILAPGQERVVGALAEGPKTAAKLRIIEPNLYRRGAGLTELEESGLVEKIDGKWQLTEFGRDYAEEHGLMEDEP